MIQNWPRPQRPGEEKFPSAGTGFFVIARGPKRRTARAEEEILMLLHNRVRLLFALDDVEENPEIMVFRVSKLGNQRPIKRCAMKLDFSYEDAKARFMHEIISLRGRPILAFGYSRICAC